MIARHPCGTQRAMLPLLPSGPDGVNTVSVAQDLAIIHGDKPAGGESGIRTHGTVKYTRFPIVPLRPLGHLSWESQKLNNELKRLPIKHAPVKAKRHSSGIPL